MYIYKVAVHPWLGVSVMWRKLIHSWIYKYIYLFYIIFFKLYLYFKIYIKNSINTKNIKSKIVNF